MTPAEVFARRLREIRTAKGWSQARVAEEMTRLGHRMMQTTVGKVETGDRSVSLEEALVFALALGVAPSAMLGTRDGRGEITIADGVTAKPRHVVAWVGGDGPLGPAEDDPDFYFANNVDVAHYIRELTSYQALSTLQLRLAEAVTREDGPDEDDVARIRRLLPVLEEAIHSEVVVDVDARTHRPAPHRPPKEDR